MKKVAQLLLSFVLLLAAFIPGVSRAEETPDPALDLWEAVVPLTTTVSFMNTGAHPDDERSQFLAYLSRGLGVQTSFLLSTRGQGGQNEIGPELGDPLGMIRTRELQASSKVLGIDIFFLNQSFDDSVKDFGFSKSPEETLQKWGESQTYERLIRYIREFKPDIIMPSFRNVDTQHGHHRAMNLLTKRAFEDAADPSVFPEQLEEGLTTWQIKKLYLPAETEEQTTTTIEIGIKDEKYDMTYPQLGEKARYLHESQGMGRDVGEGSVTVNLELVASTVGDIPEQEDSIFTDLPYDFSDFAKKMSKGGNAYKNKLVRLQDQLENVKEAYPSHEQVLDNAQQTLTDLRKLEEKISKGTQLSEELKTTLLQKLQVKEKQLTETIFTAAQLEVEIQVEDSQLTEADQTGVNITVSNNGMDSIKGLDGELTTPENWEIEGNPGAINLEPGKQQTFNYKVTVHGNDFYDAYDKPAISAELSFSTEKTEVEKVFYPDERVALLPKVSLQVDPENLVINTADVRDNIPVEVTIEKFAEGELDTEVALQLPENWSSEPASKSVSFSADESEKTVTFTLTPPPSVVEGSFTITPEAEINGSVVSTSVQTIQYPHIGTDYYLYNAKVDGVSFPLHYPENLKVGYVDSGFDKVADQLSNIGIDITKLSEEDLASGNLSQYDTIVTGIRAYLSREDLLANNSRLLEYVNQGGHLVVQYNKPWDNWNSDTTAPYKLVIGQPSIEWRVTHEDAPITVLKPESPLFNYPNTIKQSDWEGWVQERGLYFPMEWADEYETFVSVGDPGEDEFTGGILKADYGEGTYIYSNLVWYRQIQNQVPGGYRIFTNLISQPYYQAE
ncbi:PIG-L family deacetylase [Thalassobacillus devorans]|uniref:PIG-L family deacetylase n=1 Tax=Thalassobacillus devorans TaxID=279813 RepID=UPI00049196A7|nr:PIG-L family deacetylase [Thalassobacillus devorans]